MEDPKQTRRVGDSAGNEFEDQPAENPEVEEFFGRLIEKQELRRPKPSPEAIAAAVAAMQRLGADLDQPDSEFAATRDPLSSPLVCHLCGYENLQGLQFCGKCGGPLSTKAGAQEFDNLKPGQKVASGQHHYHHHYHHHYMEGGRSMEPLPTGIAKHGPASSVSPSSREVTPARSQPAGAGLSRSEAKLRQMTREWALACNNKQLDDVLSFYATDALLMRPNIPPVRGASSIREFFFTVLDSGLGDIEMEPLRVELLGDVAYEAGRCSMLVPFAVGKRREERGKYVVVFTKQAGEWKAVLDSWSSDLSLKVSADAEAPAAGPHAPPIAPKPRRI